VNAAEPDLSALGGLLAAGQSVTAARARGGTVDLRLRDVEPFGLRALVERDAVATGDVVTLRLAERTIVWFVQLAVTGVERPQVGLDLARLALGGVLPVPSERWMERRPYAGAVTAEIEGTQVHGRMQDLSPLGVGCSLPVAPAEGALVDLDVEVSGGAPATLRVRVVRATDDEHGGYLVAAEIVALAPTEWARLERALGPASGPEPAT
jgi:hypothetical protein